MKEKLCLPKGWVLVRLDSVIKTFIVPQRDRPKIFDGSIPWCRIEDIDGIYLSKSKIGLCVSKELIESMPLRVYPKGTVIVSCSADLGRCAVIATPLITNQTFIGLVPSENIDSLYLYHLMGFKSKLLNNLATGATIKYLSKNKFQELEIPLPPLPEQQRIVAILDEAFAAIAKAKANAEQNLKNAKELFESYLQGVFENKGEGWEHTRLGDVCKINDGTHFSPKNTSDGEFMYITAKNIKPYYIDLAKISYISQKDHKEIYARCSAVKGDVLYIKDGATAGIATINNLDEEFSLLSSVALLKCSPKIINTFLVHYMNSKIGKKNFLGYIDGAAITRLTLIKIKNVCFSLPPIREQKVIVQKLDSILAETQKLQAIYQQKMNDLEELKKSFLQKAFRGELKTTKALV